MKSFWINVSERLSWTLPVLSLIAVLALMLCIIGGALFLAGRYG